MLVVAHSRAQVFRKRGSRDPAREEPRPRRYDVFGDDPIGAFLAGPGVVLMIVGVAIVRFTRIEHRD
jgi:hypothetical protein